MICCGWFMDSLDALKSNFAKELEQITDIDELKALYASEILKGDKIIMDLQKQNEMILKSTLRNRSAELSTNKR